MLIRLILRERAINRLTAGMSTRTVARELNVHFSTIRFLQRRFREFGSTSNRPHNHRLHVTTPAQDLHIQHLHLISAQTVRNRLREAHLQARRPHRGLDLTAVSRRNRVEWANTHIRWHLAIWRGVLFTDGMGRFMLWTRNTGAFYLWHFECTEIPWGDLEANCIHDHPLMLQLYNAQPHVARICTQFLEAENIQVLA